MCCTRGLVRSENESRILYTIERRLYFAVQRAQHGLYTSNLLPMPMNRCIVRTVIVSKVVEVVYNKTREVSWRTVVHHM